MNLSMLKHTGTEQARVQRKFGALWKCRFNVEDTYDRENIGNIQCENGLTCMLCILLAALGPYFSYQRKKSRQPIE